MVEVVGVVLQLVVVVVIVLLLVLEAGKEEVSGRADGLRSGDGDRVGEEGGQALTETDGMGRGGTSGTGEDGLGRKGVWRHAAYWLEVLAPDGLARGARVGGRGQPVDNARGGGKPTGDGLDGGKDYQLIGHCYCCYFIFAVIMFYRY